MSIRINNYLSHLKRQNIKRVFSSKMSVSRPVASINAMVTVANFVFLNVFIMSCLVVLLKINCKQKYSVSIILFPCTKVSKITPFLLLKESPINLIGKTNSEALSAIF